MARFQHSLPLLPGLRHPLEVLPSLFVVVQMTTADDIIRFNLPAKVPPVILLRQVCWVLATLKVLGSGRLLRSLLLHAVAMMSTAQQLTVPLNRSLHNKAQQASQFFNTLKYKRKGGVRGPAGANFFFGRGFKVLSGKLHNL